MLRKIAGNKKKQSPINVDESMSRAGDQSLHPGHVQVITYNAWLSGARVQGAVDVEVNRSSFPYTS